MTKLSFQTIDLHLFCDASDVAYAASVYLRTIDDQGDVRCSFVMGKCRNSLIKRPTIPRFELLASVMSVRLSNLEQSEIDWNVNKVIFWTDSTTVLQYINNENRRHQYTKPEQWRYVPGKLNAADDGSRGLPIEAFLSDCRWWSGPEFLYKDVDQWAELKIAEIPEDDQGLKETNL